MKMKKCKDFLTKLSLCCAGFGMVSNAIFVPASAAIMQQFSDAGDFLTNYVISGNFIMAIPFAMLSAFLARYISKRHLLIGALTMFFIGGFGAAFANSMAFLAVARTLDAASDGVVTTVVASLIAEVYRDEKTRSQVMGWKEAMGTLLGIVTGIMSGVLATYGWRYPFLLNAFGFITLVLAVLFVPKTPPERERVRLSLSAILSERKVAIHIILNLLAFSLLQLVYCQVVYLIGAIVTEEGLGGSVLAGGLTSTINIAMVLAYASFSPLYLRIRRKMPVLMFLLTGLSMIAMNYFGGVFGLGAMVVLSTFAAALSYPYYAMVIAEDAPDGHVSFWMSIYSLAVYSVASFSAFLPQWIESVFHTTSILETFFVSGGVIAVAGLLMLLAAFRRKV